MGLLCARIVLKQPRSNALIEFGCKISRQLVLFRLYLHIPKAWKSSKWNREEL